MFSWKTYFHDLVLYLGEVGFMVSTEVLSIFLSLSPGAFLGVMVICFEGIPELDNQQLNLFLLLYIKFQSKKCLKWLAS